MTDKYKTKQGNNVEDVKRVTPISILSSEECIMFQVPPERTLYIVLFIEKEVTKVSKSMGELAVVNVSDQEEGELYLDNIETDRS